APMIAAASWDIWRLQWLTGCSILHWVRTSRRCWRAIKAEDWPMFIDVYGDTLCAMVSAAALASTGHQVTLHVSPGGVANTLNTGTFSLREPGLADLMLEQKREGRLQVVGLDQRPDPRVTVLWLAL